MLRKGLALAVVLIISGLAPATAVLGFCARMPCCAGEAHEGHSTKSAGVDCCTTINCFEAPPHELTPSLKAKTVAAAAPVTVPIVAALTRNTPVLHPFDDTSPPLTTTQRLSSRSILLI